MLRRSLPGPLRALARRRDLALTITPEDEALTPVADRAALGAAGGAGARWTVTPAVVTAPDVLQAQLSGRVGGACIPAWADGSHGAIAYSGTLFRATEVLHLPRYGALVDGRGRVMAASVEELAPTDAALPRIPGVRATAAGPVLALPRDLPRIERAAVFMPEGANHNWGHFLLDGLTGLLALEQSGLLESHPPIAPRLTPWAREALALAFPALTVAERPEHVLRLGEAVYTNCMAHFLHAPNGLAAEVGRRILAASPRRGRGPERVYLSRRAIRSRRMLNEAELEAALTDRGFTIRPEGLSVAEQVAFMRDARVVVGPTGAALAHVAFCAPGTRVFELQPADLTGVWARQLCLQVEAEYWTWFHRSPLTPEALAATPRSQRGRHSTCRLDLPEFLAWFDAHL